MKRIGYFLFKMIAAKRMIHAILSSVSYPFPIGIVPDIIHRKTIQRDSVNQESPRITLGIGVGKRSWG